MRKDDLSTERKRHLHLDDGQDFSRYRESRWLVQDQGIMCEKALKKNSLQDVPGIEIDLYVGDQYIFVKC